MNDNTASQNVQPAATTPPAVAPTTPTTPQIDVQALENELRKADGKADENTALSGKITALEETRKGIDDKIVSLKEDVRQKLTSLKELRTAVEEEIKKIKELEATEQKIDTELAKIHDLEQRHAEIESEIAAIEAATKLAA